MNFVQPRFSARTSTPQPNMTRQDQNISASILTIKQSAENSHAGRTEHIVAQAPIVPLIKAAQQRGAAAFLSKGAILTWAGGGGGRPSLAPGEEWLLRISPPQNGGIGGTMAL